MKKRIIISEENYKISEYSTSEWERSVIITCWEHDFELKRYVIDYKDKI